MASARFTHTSVLAEDLEESVEWYQETFGMEPVPTPDFDIPVQWMRCGDLELHLFQRDTDPAEYFHIGLHVDNFEEVYQRVRDGDITRDFDVVGTDRDIGDEPPTVYELPDGAVQMYIHDISGNLVEVNYHEVDDLDRDVVTEITPREEVNEQTGDALNAQLYLDELRADIETE